MYQIEAEVICNRLVLEYPGAKYFLLQVNAPAIAAEARPGQFCMLKCGLDTLLRRPLSIHTVNEEKVFFLYSVTDETILNSTINLHRPTEPIPMGVKGKPWLSHLEEGEIINIIGPLGNNFHVDERSKSILLAAGGIGIAPLGFLAEQALLRGRQVTLLLGARSAAGIIPENMLPSGATHVITTDDGSTGKKGFVIDILPEYLEGTDQIFACGPQAMLSKLAAMPEIRAKTVQVSLEVRMGCGVGACYGCSIRTTHGMKRVCREGPVFDIKDIIWQEVSI